MAGGPKGSIGQSKSSCFLEFSPYPQAVPQREEPHHHPTTGGSSEQKLYRDFPCS